MEELLRTITMLELLVYPPDQPETKLEEEFSDSLEIMYFGRGE